MKQLFLFFTVFVYSFSFSQEKKDKFLIAKSTIEITGNMGLWYDSDDGASFDTQSVDLTFSPNVGYTVKNNLVVGIGVGYSLGNDSYKNDDQTLSSQKRNINNYSVSSFIKKYFPISQKVAFNLKGEVSYTHRNEKLEFYNANERSYVNKYNGFFIGLSPGISLLVTKKLMLNFRLGALGFGIGTDKRFEENIYQSKVKEKDFDFALNNNYFTSGLTFLIK